MSDVWEQEKDNIMRSIIVKMKNGTEKRFDHKGRPGGSFSIRLKYEGAFAIIIDEYENQTVIPAQDILEIKTESFSRF